MAGRPSKIRRLDVWMNAEYVGQWSRLPSGQQFAYDAAWLENPARRAISLSLPLTRGASPASGPEVAAYFDNLLPDSASLRNDAATRFGAASSGTFDLLEKIGRDCVGAVQILPAGSSAPDVRRIHSQTLTEAQIETRLGAARAGNSLGAYPKDDLRLSLAGVQDKTGLLYHQGRWQLPQGATPTTHILKLPMGEVGQVRADFSSSVENEWLCAKIFAAYGLPVAKSEITQFGRYKVLAVERFDRRWMPAGWIARLPQEDFCQVFGVASSMKYEEQGGPGMDRILDTLRGSARALEDRRAFLTAQLLFWLLAAPDGHAKNFSLHLLPEGRFALTPFYDILSAWPVIGSGKRQFAWQKLKLAMAVRSNNAHYRMQEIQRRHWNAVARRNAMGVDFEAVIQDVLLKTPRVLDEVSAQLPADFPAKVSDSIFEAMTRQAAKLSGKAVELFRK